MDILITILQYLEGKKWKVNIHAYSSISVTMCNYKLNVLIQTFIVYDYYWST